MQLTADISFYPLADDYLKTITKFLNDIHDSHSLSIETNDVSTIITGEADEVFHVLEQKVKPYLEQGDVVFVIKLSNACGKTNRE
jgi:uncharacterized protein YqgV (UPF0045/DUF77 family)